MKTNKIKALLSLACASVLAAGVGVVTLNNAPVSTANAETTHTEDIFMANGASIRYSEPAGIRFIGYVKDDGDLSDNVVGMTVTDGTKTIDCSTETATTEWKWAESDVAGYRKFQVAITGLTSQQYTTELTARAYVDSTQSAEIVTRSIATVATAALAKDTLEDKLADTKITALEGYVNDAAAALPFDATDVAVENGSITWSAVDYAKGYLVQMGDAIQNVPATSEETYSVSLGEYTGEVKMLPYGDGNAYRYAEAPYTYNPASVSNVLADFNDASYVSSINDVAGIGYPESAYTWDGEPSFATHEPGTVYFRINTDDYRGDGSDWTNLAAFTVTLPNALNLASGYDGIKIRLKMQTNEEGSATLEMLAKGQNTSWNQNPSEVKVTVEDGKTEAQWVELSVTNEQLATLGYATGDTVLSFGIRTSQKRTATYGIAVKGSIDYIEYYEAEDVPVVVNRVLADFNDASYVSSISNVAGVSSNVGVYPYNGAPSFETQEPGTVYFRVYADDYRGDGSNWTNLAAFTVTLPNAINLNSNYDGIKVRLQMKVNCTGAATLEMLAKGQNTSWNQNPSPVKVTVDDGNTAAVWVELSITNAQLASLGYATGDTVLTFGIRISQKSTAPNYSANVSIDYIEYYKEGES